MHTQLPERKRIRLKGYDYSRSGIYFITVCVRYFRYLLGEIVADDTPADSQVGNDALIVPPQMRLSEYGKIVVKYTERINVVYRNVEVDHYVVMPNHVHMLLRLDTSAGDGTMRASFPTQRSPSLNTDTDIMQTNAKELKSIIRSWKNVIVRECGDTFWQRRYHDHIVRNEKDYLRIWEYIDTNAERWASDRYNCSNPDY